MKKPVFPRLLVLIAGYSAVFVLLVVSQFPRDTASVPESAFPNNRYFQAAAFIIPDARNVDGYNAIMAQWRELNFSRWAARVSDQADEDTVVAYLAEALKRERYQAALATISERPTTHETVVFLGQLAQGLRSLAEGEDTLETRVLTPLRQNGQARDLLADFGYGTINALDYLALRGRGDLLNTAARTIRAAPSAVVSPETLPAIFSGYTDWSFEYGQPDADNPFRHLIDPAYRVLGECLTLHTDRARVFVRNGNEIDAAFNLRLGKALMDYDKGSGDMAALGRSLILSTLSLVDQNGTLPALLNEDETERISSARVYRLLELGEYVPHAVNLGAGKWAWTASPLISVNMQNNTLDLAVSFPAGQTHYLFLRGFPRPAAIRLYDTEFPANPDFEQAEAGWSYSPSEETVLIKLTHRAQVEHIRVVNEAR